MPIALIALVIVIAPLVVLLKDIAEARRELERDSRVVPPSREHGVWQYGAQL